MAELRMLFLSTRPASIPIAPQRNQGSGPGTADVCCAYFRQGGSSPENMASVSLGSTITHNLFELTECRERAPRP